METLFAVKEDKSYVDLIVDLANTTKKILREKKKAAISLRAAIATTYGFRYLRRKSINWSILDKITAEVASRHPDYSIGEIAEILFELMNTRVIDCVKMKGIRIIRNTVKEEKEFLHKLLIDVIGTKFLPRYEWIIPIKKLKNGCWAGKDLKSGRILIICQSKNASYYYYSIR